jgi:hypothetical protein
MLHRRMARLALFAILLLALVPTLGRLAQARAGVGDAAPSWAAMCTARGLQPVLLPSAVHDAAHATGEAPAAPHGPAGDCDYCPLLVATIPVAVAMHSVPPAALPPALCTFHALPARAQPHPCGLGSRGPPAIS